LAALYIFELNVERVGEHV